MKTREPITFKSGDRIIYNDHGRTLFQKGHTYTFLRYSEKHPAYLQVKECINASPNHSLPSGDYEYFTWLKYIIYNIQRLIQIRKNKEFYNITCRTVSDYCRWKPFKKVKDAPMAYYKELENLAKAEKFFD